MFSSMVAGPKSVFLPLGVADLDVVSYLLAKNVGSHTNALEPVSQLPASFVQQGVSQQP